MLNAVWEDAKRQYQMGDMVTRLLILNIGAFVFVNLVRVGFYLAGSIGSYDTFLEYFMVSYKWDHLLFRPWTIFTHFFLHEGFWHILWNMLYLFWFGRILKEFAGNHRVLPVYLASGLAGFLAYLLAGVIWGGSTGLIGDYALGASAAVLGIVLAIATLAPEYRLHLIFIGPIPLKYIAAVAVFLNIISIPNESNTGGIIAHLGGALMGYLFVRQMQSGNDLSEPINNAVESVTSFFKSIFNREPKGPRMAYKNKEKVKERRKSRFSRPAKGGPSSDTDSSSKQEKIDKILDKIKASGYESLTDEEKEFLFRVSKD